jgi:hypothetical protein
VRVQRSQSTELHIAQLASFLDEEGGILQPEDTEVEPLSSQISSGIEPPIEIEEETIAQIPVEEDVMLSIEGESITRTELFIVLVVVAAAVIICFFAARLIKPG